jgi:hypothetical protein
MWIRTLTVLAALVPAVALGQPYQGYAPPPHMTTPTAQYCAHLSGELARAQDRGLPMTAEARVLAMEGNRMCERGHYLGGVVRLRRALAIMRNGD